MKLIELVKLVRLGGESMVDFCGRVRMATSLRCPLISPALHPESECILFFNIFD